MTYTPLQFAGTTSVGLPEIAASTSARICRSVRIDDKPLFQEGCILLVDAQYGLKFAIHHTTELRFDNYGFSVPDYLKFVFEPGDHFDLLLRNGPARGRNSDVWLLDAIWLSIKYPPGGPKAKRER